MDPQIGRATTSWTRRADGLAFLVILGAIVLLPLAHEGDPDLWGRLAYGRDAAAAGVLVQRADPYSYTAPGHAWIDHEWGFSWLAWRCYAALGWTGLRVLKIGTLVVTLALALGPLRPSPRSPAALFPLLGGLCALVIALGFYGPRAQVFSFLGFSWMLGCLRRAPEDPRWIGAAALPFPLWVNLHGGFLAGWGLLGLWGLAEGVRALRAGQAWPRLGWIAGAGLFAAASGLLNPWGAAFVPFLLRTAVMPRPEIGEWAPLAWWSPHGALVLAMVALAAPALRRGQRRWPELIGLVAVLVATLLHRRHLPFLGLAVAVWAGPAWLAAGAGSSACVPSPAIQAAPAARGWGCWARWRSPPGEGSSSGSGGLRPASRRCRCARWKPCAASPGQWGCSRTSTGPSTRSSRGRPR